MQRDRDETKLHLLNVTFMSIMCHVRWFRVGNCVSAVHQRVVTFAALSDIALDLESAARVPVFVEADVTDLPLVN